jgi:hypothetical protein
MDIMDKSLVNDLEVIIERTPAEWKALAAKIKSTPRPENKLDLFNVKGTLGHYAQAPYHAVSKGLSHLGTKAASGVGLSKATAAKVGAAAGSPAGVGVAAGVTVGVAAAAIYAGYKLYKRYVDAAGRACKGDKKCIVQYHLRGKKALLNSLQNSEHKCQDRRCHGHLDAKINQTKREIDELEYKLSKF